MSTVNATMTFHDEPADHRPASLPARYTLESLLARGGQGSVYTGTDTATGAPIAIKLMIAADLSAVERVHREVAAMRVLDVPGIVRILDNGHDSSRAWIVMVRVPGAPFPAGRSDWAALRPVVVALLETLARVHDAGLLHRDIKPGNVLVDEAGRPVLLDFGLVRGAVAGPTITHVGAVMGTPRYMAPEQMRGDRADRRTDLYAIGAMITEALTGKVPLETEHVGALFEARIRNDPPTLLSLRPDLPSDVAAALDSLVARRPEARPTSARAALAALRGEPAAHAMAWIGPRDPVDALVRQLESGQRGAVHGPPGSGKSRTLKEVAAQIRASGTQVHYLPPSEAPLGSLCPLLGEPHAEDVDAVQTMHDRLTAILDSGAVVLADDHARLDGWSREVLARTRGRIGITVTDSGPGTGSDPPDIPMVATLRPFTVEELAAMIEGPERLLHLPSDGAAMMLRRTGGLAARVVSEIQRWVDAELAQVIDGKLHVARAALDRVMTGMAGPPLGGEGDDDLPADLDDLLAWVHLAGPQCTVPRLAAARGEPVWRVAMRVQQLATHAAVVVSEGVIEPLRAADALMTWPNDVRMAAHAAMAQAMPPGTSGRMYPLVTLGHATAAVEDACALAARLSADAQLPEAIAALTEAGRLALSSSIDAPELWKQLTILALQDGTRPVLAGAAELTARAGAEPCFRQLLDGAVLLASGDPQRAAGIVRGIAPQTDPEVERLRWDLRLQVARGEGTQSLTEATEAADVWARDIPIETVQASRADWRSLLLYQAGAMREAADVARAGARLDQPLTQRMRLMLRAIGCMVIIADVNGARELGAELRNLARQRRLPRMEAWAEWTSRLLDNQLRIATGPDEELIHAVGAIGAPDVAGLVWVNEAVIAWWTGDPTRGAELAARAEQALLGVGIAPNAVWARAVHIACAPDPDAATACAADAIATGRNDIIIEVLGVLKLSGGLPGDWSKEVQAAYDQAQPIAYRHWRRGALSPDEVLAAFGLGV
jgi:hypothetical protein